MRLADGARDFDATGLGITAWMGEHARDHSLADDGGHGMGRRSVIQREQQHPESMIPDTGSGCRLGPAMRTAGVAVYEEELRLTLLNAMA